MDYIDIHIGKPIYGSYISIDMRKIEEAQRQRIPLRISIAGQGTAIVTPEEWLKNGMIKKQIVNYPNSPMYFVYGHVHFKQPEIKLTNQQLNLV